MGPEVCAASASHEMWKLDAVDFLKIEHCKDSLTECTEGPNGERSNYSENPSEYLDREFEGTEISTHGCSRVRAFHDPYMGIMNVNHQLQPSCPPTLHTHPVYKACEGFDHDSTTHHSLLEHHAARTFNSSRVPNSPIISRLYLFLLRVILAVLPTCWIEDADNGPIDPAREIVAARGRRTMDDTPRDYAANPLGPFRDLQVNSNGFLLVISDFRSCPPNITGCLPLTLLSIAPWAIFQTARRQDRMIE
ncbi:hypothetical protein BS47DRAFT_1392525 [Hydnum rufescens UP504]|uniref:Uncharacterized protein n=1 Tax=Hydnum rufescens UP504 TaxID=1448309 RepID=A0A9P6DTK5_9AGAM|nr:hypothetical protein BS47DRAFT_1392525 [Hydnum rufescens UP504]